MRRDRMYNILGKREYGTVKKKKKKKKIKIFSQVARD